MRTRRARVSYTYPRHEFKIADAKTHEEWERLLGFPLHVDKVVMPHEVYEDLAPQVQAIQMRAATRMRTEYWPV